MSLRFLVKLYELSEGGIHPEVPYDLVKSSLGFSSAESRSVVQYLLSKDLVTSKCKVPCIKITPRGVDEAERIMQNQKGQILEKLYKLANGRIEMVSVADLAESLGLSFDETYDDLRYWEDRSLVELSRDVDREYETVKFTRPGLNAIEQPNAPDTPQGRHLNVTYNLTLHDNHGNIDMGGRSNTQSVNVRVNSFDEAAKRLLDLVEQSDLAPVNKITIKGDVQTLIQLNQLEKTSEVKEAARSKLSVLDKALSVSADIYTLAVPFMPLLLAPFK